MKYFFYIFILGSVLVTGCVDDYDAPCRDQVIATKYTFSATQSEVIPYSEQDTLVYAAGANDTLYMITAVYKDTFSIQLTNKPNNPECPNDYESHQILYLQVKDILSPFTLGYRSEQQSGICKYTIGPAVLEVPLSAIGANDSTYLDSVLLGNTMYYEVNRFTTTAGDPVYINASLGLLQLEKDQKKYTLQKFNDKSWK